tara:strand:+ start:9541 stop:9873 length:333 start_codon:yes stop_codon:yes gene_type:complete
MIEILTYAVIGLAAVFIFDYLIARSKIKSTLKLVSELAIELCEERDIPKEYSSTFIKRNHTYLLRCCKLALKGPNLNWFGISDRQLEVISLQALITALSDDIAEEHSNQD